ncbi:MAG TPA: hypothetical protein VK066_17830 [Chloroflexota bacterium]|nr:hypothetical protein [Chloroflexota bacterium]
MQHPATNEPHSHVEWLKGRLNETIEQVETDTGLVSDPRALALFEATREVLAGLVRALDRYEQGGEPAARRGSEAVAPAATGAE